MATPARIPDFASFFQAGTQRKAMHEQARAQSVAAAQRGMDQLSEGVREITRQRERKEDISARDKAQAEARTAAIAETAMSKGADVVDVEVAYDPKASTEAREGAVARIERAAEQHGRYRAEKELSWELDRMRTIHEEQGEIEMADRAAFAERVQPMLQRLYPDEPPDKIKARALLAAHSKDFGQVLASHEMALRQMQVERERDVLLKTRDSVINTAVNTAAAQADQSSLARALAEHALTLKDDLTAASGLEARNAVMKATAEGNRLRNLLSIAPAMDELTKRKLVADAEYAAYMSEMLNRPENRKAIFEKEFENITTQGDLARAELGLRKLEFLQKLTMDAWGVRLQQRNEEIRKHSQDLADETAEYEALAEVVAGLRQQDPEGYETTEAYSLMKTSGDKIAEIGRRLSDAYAFVPSPGAIVAEIMADPAAAAARYGLMPDDVAGFVGTDVSGLAREANKSSKSPTAQKAAEPEPVKGPRFAVDEDVTGALEGR